MADPFFTSLAGCLRRRAEAHPFVVLGLLALAVRLATMPLVPAPGYMDACYYYGVAERLYHGHGFTENVIWSYLTPPASLEHPADPYWMPLQSLAIRASFALFGENFRAAQVPGAIFSSALCLLAAWCAWDLTRSRRCLWWTGLFAIFSGFWFPHWVNSDYIALYGLVGAGALVLTYRALRDDPRFFVPAGVCAGLAYLTRGHGLLFAAVMPVCWLLVRRMEPGRHTNSGLWLIAGLAAALLTVSPWLVYFHVVHGAAPSPVLKLAFQRDFNDLYFYAQPINLSYFLNQTCPSPEWGLWPLAKSKLVALWVNLDLWARPALFFLAPFLIVGFLARSLWRRVELLPFWIYSVGFYLLISLVFTLPGIRGTTFHVAGAILPFVLPVALIGLDTTLEWLGRRFRPDAIEERRRIYTLLAFAGAVVLSAIWTEGTARFWRAHDDAYHAIAVKVAPQVPQGKAVMVMDPPAYYYAARRPAVVIASDGPAAAAAAARRYDVCFLILEARGVPPTFVRFYETNAASSPDWQPAGEPLPGVRLFSLRDAR
ncbi:MAG: glycosyltransferase family 39 protein [Verrucomicrobia bacterium]|nr:glycosyltransferase family 39 protein [Verrucomicrobiota bacterium]